MTLAGSPPDSWYDPPDDPPVDTCRDCGGEGVVDGEVPHPVTGDAMACDVPCPECEGEGERYLTDEELRDDREAAEEQRAEARAEEMAEPYAEGEAPYYAVGLVPLALTVPEAILAGIAIWAFVVIAVVVILVWFAARAERRDWGGR